MATPLIEEIESCKADIARFENELVEIIKDADADGIRDDEEKEEIKRFEDSIAHLKQFVVDKDAEFKRNEAEWNGLSSAISELMANFQTLTDWGTPNLATVDGLITQMDTHAGSRFYRDAINTYQSAQDTIDPLMEEYNKQSAAKLDYDEAMDAAWDRVKACRASDTISRDITARLDQVETDFQSCDIMAERLDYVGALSALQPTLDEITNIDGMIEEVGKEIERLNARYAEMLTKRSEAFGKMADRTDMVQALDEKTRQAEATFKVLINDRYFEQADRLIIQTEVEIAAALKQLEAVEAAEAARAEKEATDQTLQDKDRDPLAAELSASAPDGTLWKLYEWQEGDSFDGLAKTSKLDTADKISGHPNNKKASDYYRINNELPAGTLVAVLDPTVEVYELQVADEKHYLTKSDLDCIGVSDMQLMNAIAFSLNSTLNTLRDAHDQINEARDGWAGYLFLSNNAINGEPKTQRTKAQAHEGALLTFSMLDDSKAFADAMIIASKDISAWQDGLVTWLDMLQSSINWKLSVLWVLDVAAKTTATTLMVTFLAPAAVVGIPYAALINIGTTGAAGAATGATVSLMSEVGRLAASAVDDIVKPPTAYEVFTSMATGAMKGGVAAGFTSWFMQKPSQAIFTRLGTWKPPSYFWSSFEAGGRINAAIAKLALKAGVTPPPVTTFVEVPMKVIHARLTMGAIKGFMLEPGWKWLKENVNSLFDKEETAAIEIMVHGIATDEACEAIMLDVISENQTEFERLVFEEIDNYFADMPVSEP